MFWRDLVLALVRLRARKCFSRFDQAASDIRRVQEQVLLAKVARNADSDFGRRHDFTHIDSVENFRQRVPVCDYSYLRPYIDRVRRGEFGALFGSGEQVRMFALTSGTTDEPKYIPITESFLKEYRTGWHIWGWGVYRDHRLAYEGDLLTIVSRHDEQTTPTGTPCGAVSGLMAEMQPRMLRWFYPASTVVNRVHDAESKYYLILRLCLTRNITFCCTPNPSTLLRLSEIGNRRARELIRDIEQGGVSERCSIPDSVRDRLRRRLRPSPRRARRLAKLLDREGRLLPRDYWPRLKILAVWKGGTVSLYLPRLAEAFGPVPTRDIGLLASEGRMSIPLSDDGSAGVLDLMHQFFEFIPEDEVDSEHPHTLLAHQVELGQRYYVVLTTSGGCYRYNIMDHVEVVDRYKQTPVIEFLNKGEHISSLTGEKLTERQVVHSLQRAQDGLGIPPMAQLTLTPVWDDPPYYLLLAPDGSIDPNRWSTLLRRLERELCLSNIEYAQKRESGRLGPPRVRIVRPEQFAAALNEERTRLRNPEQQKHVFLVPDVDYHGRFEAVQELGCVAESVPAEGGLRP